MGCGTFESATTHPPIDGKLFHLATMREWMNWTYRAFAYCIMLAVAVGSSSDAQPPHPGANDRALVPTSEGQEAESSPPKRGPRRHHFGVQLGFFHPSTDAIELGRLGFRVEHSDGQTGLTYRYSLNPRVDIVAEGRYWIGRGPTEASGEGKVAGGFIGPGIRLHSSNRSGVGTYVQANLYYVQEMLGEPKVLYETGLGLGLSGGVDIELTPRISLPLEATYLRSFGKDLDDLSGFGVSIGISFNF